MSAREEIVDFIKTTLTNIKDVLGNINEIKQKLENISVNECEDNEFLNETKRLVDGLFEKSSKTKETFYIKYKKVVKGNRHKSKESSISECEQVNDNLEKNVEEHSLQIRNTTPSVSNNDLELDTNVNNESLITEVSDIATKKNAKPSKIINEKDNTDSKIGDCENDKILINEIRKTTCKDKMNTNVNHDQLKVSIDESSLGSPRNSIDKNNEINENQSNNDVDEDNENVETIQTELYGHQATKDSGVEDMGNKDNEKTSDINEVKTSDKEMVDNNEIIEHVNIDPEFIDTNDISETLKHENVEEQNKENIDVRPRIRLVSLDKLMAKPRKAVTFDTSVIVLTSSDEEGPQKKMSEIPEQNGTLKSALKNSLTTKETENVTETKKDDISVSPRKSPRVKEKLDDKLQQRAKLRSIFTRTKPNEWKGKNICESDSDDDRGNVTRRKKPDKVSRTNCKKIHNITEKFSSTIYVPLPRIECEKLQEACIKNPNIFCAQSKSVRVSEKNVKRLHKHDSDSSSEFDEVHIIESKRKRKDSEGNESSKFKRTKENVTADESDDSDKEIQRTQKISRKGNDDDNEEDVASESERLVETMQEESEGIIDKRSDSDGSKDECQNTKNVENGSSDSEGDFTARKNVNKRHKKKNKKKVVSSDSENSEAGSKENRESSENSSKSGDDEHSNEKADTKKKPRRRIKRTKDSSDSEEEISTRKQIRKLIDKDSLSETTKKAEAEEKNRKARIAEKQKKYNAILGETKDATVEKVVLEFDEKTEKELLSVDSRLVNKLKPHQASGVRFMWDACFESLERAKSDKGSGCILAHCMGLGKTLQVITLSHTLLQNKKLTGVNKIMVVCPVNTVFNWRNEFKKWLPKKSDLNVFELVSCKQMYEKRHRVAEWHEDGGVMIIGYTMFRNISNPDNKKIQKKIRETFLQGLVDPGPDLVVCDEGHLLKNEKTHLSIAMNRIKTARRIVLTGTPLQNNLKEYWCMVQFIKPNLLGTYKEYLNRFVNPITNGQYTDSTQHDIVLMRKRSHVLHKLLDGVVQRKDYSVLEPYLPPKHEYVLFVRLSDVQVKLYKHYMENSARKNSGSSKVSYIFVDFQQLQRICTHPRVLLDKSSEKRDKLDDSEESEGSLKDFIDDRDANSSATSSSSSGSDSDSDASNKDEKSKNKRGQKVRITRAAVAERREKEDDSDPDILEIQQKEWWQEFCDGNELDNINNSGKLSLLFQLLRECEEIGDKILIFSQSLYTLNCIEYFLGKIDEATQEGNTEQFGGYSGTWHIGLDYFRLDGSSSCDNRATWCDMFNSPDNTRARLFLISTKAGGLGINLVAANRVIIFDVSWNPSHDVQSIYRVFRFGQTKPCYIYRFVTFGAMEMKIYERQVTKQAISKRVIDEQQIDRHYNQNDLQELYKCELVPEEERPIPLVPKDVLLGEMLQNYDKIIYKYHEHQSLLENKAEECLNEEERKAAWEEFENEKVLRKNTYNMGPGKAGLMLSGVNAQLIATALANIVRRDNPTWSEVQVQGIIPALVQQLKVQLSENDTSMYYRVQQEIQRMQAEAREAEFQRQMMQMYAQTQYMQAARQQMMNNNLGNMHVNPSTARNVYNNIYGRLPNPIASGSRERVPRHTNDVIELND